MDWLEELCALCSVLDQTEHQIVQAVRISTTPWEVPVSDLNGSTDWSAALGQNTDVVVHLAAQVPEMDSASRFPGDRYAEVNTLGTANLARQCAQHEVKRFIFISTIKVLGEGKSEPYQDTDWPCQPTLTPFRSGMQSRRCGKLPQKRAWRL